MEKGNGDKSSLKNDTVQKSIFPLPKISIEAEKNCEEKIKEIEGLESKISENRPSSSSLKTSSSPKSRSLSIPIEFQTNQRRKSYYHEIIQTSFSEGSRLNEEKAIELEGRLKKLANAFSSRTKKTVAEIQRPPTPSSEDSESDLSTVSETNLLNRLEAFLPTPETSRRPSSTESLRANRKRAFLQRLHKFWRILTCRYLLDPQNTTYISWLGIVSIWFVYNAWVLPLRVAFRYQTVENSPIWFIIDSIADVFYVLDIILFKSHLRFVQEGFQIESVKESWMIYFQNKNFIIDLLALLPLDILSSIYYQNMPWLRLPRLLKISTFWELFERLDSALSSPHTARIGKTLLYMVYMIHLNASAYYALSMWEGHGATEWTYGYGASADGNAYIRCFYFATKTATSIGKNPRPSNEIEYLFMTFAWLSGVFIFALLIGQIRDIIATATKAQTEYRQVCYTTFNYLHRFEVPGHLQNKVKSWLNYTWAEQKTLDEGMIIAQLPQKMQADLALHVHIETLSKVKLFQNCETAFLRDLVVKLRSIIFLPGDYVCRKGEVGKEMYIIKAGRIHVIGGASGHAILATLTAGSVFGEIALLAIGGMTKRTADVRTAGFANLFVLNKTDLNEAIKDYPQAQENLRKKAKKLIRENIKKRKEMAHKEAARSDVSNRSSATKLDLDYDDDEKIIIKNKSEQPRFVDTVLKAVKPNSMTAKYLKYGSKASSIDYQAEEQRSYPPSPYLPVSAGNLTTDLGKSFISDSSDEELNFRLPDSSFNQPMNIDQFDDDNDDEVFSYVNKGFDTMASTVDDEGDELNNETLSPPEPPPPLPKLPSSLPPTTSGTKFRPSDDDESSNSSGGRSKYQLQRQFSVDVTSYDDEST